MLSPFVLMLQLLEVGPPHTRISVTLLQKAVARKSSNEILYTQPEGLNFFFVVTPMSSLGC